MILGSGCKPLAAENGVKYVSLWMPSRETSNARQGNRHESSASFTLQLDPSFH